MFRVSDERVAYYNLGKFELLLLLSQCINNFVFFKTYRFLHSPFNYFLSNLAVPILLQLQRKYFRGTFVVEESCVDTPLS